MLLEKLDTMTLDKKVAVIIPLGEMKSEYFINQFATMFSNFFGGASVQDIDGFYTMEDGSLCNDKNKIVYAYYNEMNEEQAQLISIMVKRAKMELYQECIGIEYDGAFHLVF